MAQNLPSKIGKYEVLEILGQGGMGTVYKAIDPLIGRLVAIKVIVADCIDNPELLKRFYREAKAVGNLQHPNIVIVYDLGEENKNPYLVMEYLDGEPLNTIIAGRRELPLVQKLAIIAKVCDALFYAHQRDIVHRDVKPANVMLLKDRQVKLLDFGIARLGNTGYNQTETRKGQVMGTMSYMSPEQLNEEIVDGRSDVYSTGVMLFELVTYKLPFEASDLASLIAKKMQGIPPPPLSKYIENYPPELDEILARALAKDRDERQGSAQDFAFDLERLIERLKRDMVSHYVERARECISSAELGKAKDLLSEVLKIDTQHTAAKQLLYEVHQAIQKQQRLEHIRQLQQHSREAIAQKQFDDASKFADEAIKLDGTDPDSLNLREHIQQVKLRAQQVKKLLHLAEVAQQTGELGVFQRAVSDALALDPEDPQARVLQASLIRLQAEQEKEAKIQELLVAARRDIATRQFDAAQENILKVEVLDPHRQDIPALKQMVLGGQQQEARTRQLQQLCREIQQELEANNLRTARDLAERALRAFPGEPALLRMKSASESQIEAEQRRKYIEEQIAFASRWIEGGEPSRALLVVQEASRQFPTDTRLRDFLQMVRQSVQQDAVRRGQLAVLAQARDEMQHKRFADAVEILEAGQLKYPDLRDISDLLFLARKEQELLVKKNRIAVIGEEARNLLAHQAFGDALCLLEKTLVDTPDPGLEQLLQNVRAQAAEFDAGLDALKKESIALLDSDHSAEALMKLRLQASKFGNSMGFRDLLQRAEERVAAGQESRQQVARVLEEARLYLRRGALPEAEAALAECRAKAPRDPSVIAFSSQVQEAKAAVERDRVKPPFGLEIPPRQEPKSNALPATLKYNLSPTVAALTPPEGTTVSPKDLDPGISEAPTPEIPANSERKSATSLFAVLPVEPAIAPDRKLPEGQQSGSAQQEDSPTPILPPAPRKSRATTIGAGMLLISTAAVLIILWLKPGKASLDVHTNPGADVRIVGENISGKATTDGTLFLQVPPGSYQVQVSLANHKPKTESVTVKAGERHPIEIDLPNISQPLVGEKPPIAATGNLLVQSNLAGADVFIDEQPKGVTGRDNKLTLQLDPGTHRVGLKKSGYQDPAEQSIEIVAKKERQLLFDLHELEGQTYLKIDSRPPGASVRIDDKAAGSTVRGRSLSAKVIPGFHTVELNLDGYEQWTAKVRVKEGENAPIRAELVPKAVPAPNVVSFAATPRTIQKGGKSLLRWETQNATEVSIEGVGAVRSNGEQEIFPSESVTYKLTAKGAGGSKTAEASVSVTEPPAAPPSVSIVSFKAIPETIQEGAETTLKWETQNASEVSIEGVGSFGPKGERRVSPSANATYKLTATGTGASNTAEARVNVRVVARIVDSGNDGGEAKNQEQLVNDAFKRYQELYKGRVANMRSIWPNESQAQIDAFKNFFAVLSGISLQEQCFGTPSISADGTAELTCKEITTKVINGSAQPKENHTIRFRFRKKGEQWYLDSRSATN
jgi:serine/threonine-protein kinase